MDGPCDSRGRPPGAEPAAAGAAIPPAEAYRRHGASTFAFFLRRVGDPERAADLNQELFLRYLRTLSSWQGRCSLRTWLFLLARRILVDERRAAAARIPAGGRDGDEVLLARIVAAEAGPDEEIARRRRVVRLRQCIGRLDAVTRAVIVGHYVHGLTLRELTARLGLGNPSGARAVVLRGLRRLRRCLEMFAGGADQPREGT